MNKNTLLESIYNGNNWKLKWFNNLNILSEN